MIIWRLSIKFFVSLSEFLSVPSWLRLNIFNIEGTQSLIKAHKELQLTTFFQS